MQWSTLLVPKPVLTNFWNRYASSLDPLADPKPARELPPWKSRTFFSPFAAQSRASFQETFLKYFKGFFGSKILVGSFLMFGFLTRGSFNLSGLVI